MWWFNICIYCEMITAIKLIDTSITSHSYLFFVVRILKIYSLSKFQVYDTVLLPRTYSPYNWKLVSFGQDFLISSIPWQAPFYSLVLWVRLSEIIQYWSFCVWLISLSMMSCTFIHVIKDDRTLFLRLNNIPLYVYPTFALFRQARRLVPYLGFCEQCCSEHGNADISLRYWFNFLWIYTQKGDCWIIW